jgi:hypothetical protein
MGNSRSKLLRYNKYKAEKHRIDGYTFDSKKEAQRYADLRLLVEAGEIRDLRIHPRFPLEINPNCIVTYVADFSYLPKDGSRTVVEDVKGVKTPVYRLKKKLMKAIYGIDIQEI